MEVVEIKNHIQNRQFNSFYIFTGPEWKVQRLYIDNIAKASGKELRYVESMRSIYSKLTSNSFISTSYVYVIRDDKDILQDEKLQSKLESVLGQNILILLLTTPDKRTKFYKQYKDTICEFEALKPAVLKKYILKEIALSDKSCDTLMEICEYDYGRCLLEIDKILRFDHEMTIGKDNAFEHLLYEGTIYQPPKDAIFDFIDAVLDHKVDKAYDLYEQCKAVGEAVMVILTVLYNNAKAVLQVQSCTSSDICKSTGLTSYQVFGAKKHLNKYKNGQLIHIMKMCQQCQEGIVTGKIDEDIVVDYILTDVM